VFIVVLLLLCMYKYVVWVVPRVGGDGLFGVASQGRDRGAF